MEINPVLGQEIVRVALSNRGRKYQPSYFTSVDFVRLVYRIAGAPLPRLHRNRLPAWYNLTKDDVSNPPPGYLIFVRSHAERHWVWTHAVIAMPAGQGIYCSDREREIIIVSLQDLYRSYAVVVKEDIRTAPK